MSDSFCVYVCVLSFKSQYKNVHRQLFTYLLIESQLPYLGKKKVFQDYFFLTYMQHAFVLFFKFILNWGKFLYNVLLVSSIKQFKSAIIIHLSPPSWASLLPTQGSSQSTRLGSLCCIVASHQLSALHVVEYICQCYFLYSSHACPYYVHNSILQVSIPSHIQVHQYHFSRSHIYALIYDICFSFPDLLHSV